MNKGVEVNMDWSSKFGVFWYYVTRLGIAGGSMSLETSFSKISQRSVHCRPNRQLTQISVLR
jgi:hypothetical protein